VAKRTPIKDADKTRRSFTSLATSNTVIPMHSNTRAREGKPETVRATFIIRADQPTSLEEIQLQERKRTGRKPEKSELVQEALDDLKIKYAGK